MSNTYKLIEPNNDVIDLFNSFWDEKAESIDDWNVQLFKDRELVDIRKYVGKNNDDIHMAFGKVDEEIKKLWDSLKESDSSEEFLKIINKHYHTRVKNIKSIKLTKKDLMDMDVKQFIEECYPITKRYDYSFATKVFSFIYPEKNPILDSFSTTLIWYYLSDDRREKYPKSKWGDYEEYKNAYNAFIEQYNLKCDYKRTDKFLWTYATCIQNYWIQECGILSFGSVSYKKSSD